MTGPRAGRSQVEDLVLAEEVLEHVPDAEGALAVEAEMAGAAPRSSP